MPSRAIERPLVLPRGWSEGAVHLASARATADGQGQLLDSPWRRAAGTIGLRWGLAPGVEVAASLPVIWTRREVAQLGVGRSDLRFRLGRSAEAPSRSIAVDLGVAAPMGFEGGGVEGGRVPLSMGTLDLGLGGAAAIAWSGLRGDLRVEGWRRFGGRPDWSPGGFTPGDLARAEATVRVQFGPLSTGPTGQLEVYGPPSVDGQRVEEGAGWRGRARWGLAVDLTRGWSVEVAWSVPARTEDAVLAALDEVHPVRWRSMSVGTEVRW